MRLTHLTLKNISGLDHYDTDLPPVAIVGGANGKGKSSLTDAIMYAAGRRVGASGTRGVEHDPSMLHGDAERGEIICTFDDPDGNLQHLKCIVAPGETTRWTKAHDSTKYVKAGSNLDEYFNALGYDPFKMKTMKPQERIENLFRIIPPPVTADEIKTAVGGVVPCQPFPAIQTIQALLEDIFQKRTEVNRDADTLKKQARLLEDAPGVGDGQNWVAILADLRLRAQTLEAGENEEILRIQKEFNDTKSKASELRRLGDIEEDKKFDARISAINNERAESRRSTAWILENNISAARQKADLEGKEIAEANQTIRVDLVTGIADAEARARLQTEAEGTRKAAEKVGKDAVAAEQRSSVLTQAIDRLRQLKTEVAKRMDLDGATIEAPRPGMDVDLCREESGALVPFSAWNTRDQEVMCLRLGLRAQAKCGLLIIDSIGNFDPLAREQLRDTCRWYAENKGISFIVGQATGGPLKVEAW